MFMFLYNLFVVISLCFFNDVCNMLTLLVKSIPCMRSPLTFPDSLLLSPKYYFRFYIIIEPWLLMGDSYIFGLLWCMFFKCIPKFCIVLFHSIHMLFKFHVESFRQIQAKFTVVNRFQFAIFYVLSWEEWVYLQKGNMSEAVIWQKMTKFYCFYYWAKFWQRYH